MIELLLVVIAVGVLLQSNEGKYVLKWLLLTTIRIAKILAVLALIAAILFGISEGFSILREGITNTDAPSWMKTAGKVSLYFVAVAIYFVIGQIWTSSRDKIKDGRPDLYIKIVSFGKILAKGWDCFFEVIFYWLLVTIAAVVTITLVMMTFIQDAPKDSPNIYLIVDGVVALAIMVFFHLRYFKKIRRVN